MGFHSMKIFESADTLWMARCISSDPLINKASLGSDIKLIQAAFRYSAIPVELFYDRVNSPSPLTRRSDKPSFH